ncbi:hypothetical protein ES705_39498 [subsurface metagenome]
MVRQRARINRGQVQLWSFWTAPDTNIHVLDISPFVPETCIGIFMTAIRKSGTGYLKIHTKPSPITDTIQKYMDYEPAGFVGIVNQTLVLELETANDVFDIHMHGYVTQPKTSSDKP